MINVITRARCFVLLATFAAGAALAADSGADHGLSVTTHNLGQADGGQLILAVGNHREVLFTAASSGGEIGMSADGTVLNYSIRVQARGDSAFLGEDPLLELSPRKQLGLPEDLRIDPVSIAALPEGTLMRLSWSLLDAAGEPTGELTLVLPAAGSMVDDLHDLRQISGSLGPDVIVGSLPSIHHWTLTGNIQGYHAYSVATTSCNVGTLPLNWFQSPDHRHPVIAQNMYRLMDGRFEQIGQSWLKHGFCALQQTLCGSCTPYGDCCCQRLGVGCSDPYSASRNGSFSYMGPRSEINATLGTNLGNHASPGGHSSLRGRIVVPQSDLSSIDNPGALYFVEGQYVAQDDAQADAMTNDNNNASHRQVTFNPANYNPTLTGPTVTQMPAIYAWQTHDPEVTIVTADVPQDGRFILGYKVSEVQPGLWHYEYALYNMNSDRSAGSFSVPLGGGAVAGDIGFRDVFYHSGEIYSGTDWAVAPTFGTLTWAGETFAQNVNANALRWGTLYNFRFDSNAAPVEGEVTVGLFKPGTPTVLAIAAEVPGSVPPMLVHGAADTSFEAHAFGGYIDPRIESTNGTDADLGIDAFDLRFNTAVFTLGGAPLTAANFEVTHTAAGDPPAVIAVDTTQNPHIVVQLDRPIALQGWTTIQAVDVQNVAGALLPDLGNLGEVSEPDRIDIAFLPGDIDQNGLVEPLDLLRFRQYAGGTAEPEAGIAADYIDTDRNGAVQPLDLLRYRQMISGTFPSTQAWAGTGLNTQRP